MRSCPDTDIDPPFLGRIQDSRERRFEIRTAEGVHPLGSPGAFSPLEKFEN